MNLRFGAHKQEVALYKAAFALVIGLAIMALTQYAVIQAPHGFNADAFGYLCYYTVAALDYASVSFHFGGLRGAAIVANIFGLVEIAAIITFVVWFGLRGAVNDLPTRGEFYRFVERGGPTDGWGRSLLVWACIFGIMIVLGALFYYGCQTVGQNWTPWVQDKTPYLLLAGIAICVVGALASPLLGRSQEN